LLIRKGGLTPKDANCLSYHRDQVSLPRDANVNY